MGYNWKGFNNKQQEIRAAKKKRKIWFEVGDKAVLRGLPHPDVDEPCYKPIHWAPNAQGKDVPVPCVAMDARFKFCPGCHKTGKPPQEKAHMSVIDTRFFHYVKGGSSGNQIIGKPCPKSFNKNANCELCNSGKESKLGGASLWELSDDVASIMERKSMEAAGYCKNCGTPGLTPAAWSCPECGKRHNDELPELFDAIVCPSCGVTLMPGSFDIEYKCHKCDKPEPAGLDDCYFEVERIGPQVYNINIKKAGPPLPVHAGIEPLNIHDEVSPPSVIWLAQRLGINPAMIDAAATGSAPMMGSISSSAVPAGMLTDGDGEPSGEIPF